MKIAPPAFQQKRARAHDLGAAGLCHIAGAQGSTFRTVIFLKPNAGVGAILPHPRDWGSILAVPVAPPALEPCLLQQPLPLWAPRTPSIHPLRFPWRVLIQVLLCQVFLTLIIHLTRAQHQRYQTTSTLGQHAGRDIYTPSASRQGCGEQCGPLQLASSSAKCAPWSRTWWGGQEPQPFPSMGQGQPPAEDPPATARRRWRWGWRSPACNRVWLIIWLRVIFLHKRLHLLPCHSSGRPPDPLISTLMGINPLQGAQELPVLGQGVFR